MFNGQAVLWALIPALVFAGYVRRKRALSTGGALTAVVLGLWVIGWAGWLWLVPLFAFFITGTLLSRLNRTAGLASDAKHDKPRDAVQVLCNGSRRISGYSWISNDGVNLLSNLATTLLVVLF